MILILFILGVMIGVAAGILWYTYNLKRRRVGSLVIDLVNPLNDQPFLLELSSDVNEVCRRDYIVLEVKTQK